MYKNLIAEMAKGAITKRAMAKILGVHENTLKNKIAGKTKFDIEESFTIKNTYFPDKDFSYLFATDETETKTTA